MSPQRVREILFEETHHVPGAQTASAVLRVPVPAYYTFGRFQVLPIGRKLLVDGRTASLGGRALDLLLTLIEHRERMLTKDELLDRVWPDAVVEPNNLAVQISALRKLLGPDAIATIPGRGYRFGLSLDEVPGPAPRAAAPSLHAKATTNLAKQARALNGRAEPSAAQETLPDRHALVMIIGAGGIGMSLLALHLSHRRQGAFRHGVCLVEVAAVNETVALTGAVASAHGAELRAGEPAAARRSALVPLTRPVALANAEHLLDAVSALAAALDDAEPMLRRVVTSQARRPQLRRSATAP